MNRLRLSNPTSASPNHDPLTSLGSHPIRRRTALIQVGAILAGTVTVAACDRFQRSGSGGGPLIIGFLMGAGGLGDLSFNDMTYAGLEAAQKQFGSDILILPQELDEGREQEEAREKAMQSLIQEGSSVIVVNGFEFKDIAAKYAERHPKVYFLINDVPLEGFSNVAYTSYGQHEGSFLAGVLAALMTQTKTIGVIGGVDIDVVKAFHQGYREGIAYADPDVELLETYVTRVPDFSGFNSPEEGYQAAVKQYQEGADIVFAVAGFTGNGVIRAAKDQDKFAIGVDADQDHLAPGHVLTSMMKRLDNATLAEITKIVEGNFQPGETYYGLKEGGVSLSPMRYTKDLIPADVMAQVEEAKRKIIAGEITVTNLLTAPSS